MVTKGLFKKDVQNVVKSHLDDMEACCKQAGKPLKGKVIFKLVVDKTGRVIKVMVAESDIEDSVTEACMVQKIKQWVFPRSLGGKKGKVRVVFILT